jgi:hypothetical protein
MKYYIDLEFFNIITLVHQVCFIHNLNSNLNM